MQGVNREDSGRSTGKKRKRNLLTGSNSSSPTSTGLCGSTTKGEQTAQPAEGQLTTATVKVRCECAGSLEGLDLVAVGRVADSQDSLEPARTGGDGTAVDPDVEAGTSTVGAVATLADTTEGQGRDVQSGVVDGDTTGTGGSED